jgi:hypothetical protein
LAFGISLIASLVNLWPIVESTAASAAAKGTGTGGGAPSRQTVHILFAIATVKVTPGTALLLVVVIAGALGSVIHTATSFSDFVGNRRMFTSWVAWYVLRPLIGSSLALLTYFALRGGFLNGNGESSNVNPYGITALGGFAGLFSKQATDKLREVFETLFRVSEKLGDAERKDDLSNPAPVIKGLDPKSVRAGTTGLTLAISGEKFVANATVGVIDKAEQETTFVSAQLIKVVVPDQMLAHHGELKVTVKTAAPGGGSSEPLGLLVTR